jgi:hypothetical protein
MEAETAICNQPRTAKVFASGRFWIREIFRACRKQKIPFFFKQWGGVRKHLTERRLNGENLKLRAIRLRGKKLAVEVGLLRLSDSAADTAVAAFTRIAKATVPKMIKRQTD